MDKFWCTRIIGGSRQTPATVLLLFGLFMALSIWFSPTAHAETRPPDQACKLCHAENSDELVLPSGETVQLGVDLAALDQSVHGTHAAGDVYCTDCHRSRERYLYPHQPNPAQTHQDFADDISGSCQRCHTPLESHNPGHLQAKDNENLPTCVDCHGGHSATSTAELAADPVGTCQSCHVSYSDDAHIQEVHEEIAGNLASDQTCEACHGSAPRTADAKCKTCHTLLTSQLVLGPDETVSVHMDPEEIVTSVHGDRVIQGVEYTTLQCTDCHRDQGRYGFPHPELTEETVRELTIDMEVLCQECHQEIYQKHKDSVHDQANGNMAAATCADCHGNHAIHDPDEPRERVSQTCATCHSTINEAYAHSVHGAALLGEHNPDVPVCTDCHGVHDIVDPLTAEFRVNSPDMCAGCHADTEMMDRYGISTEVFDTYVADFHGTTVELFEKQSPEQETNKAVCYDCHGVHNILPATDEHSQVIKENLLTTCRQCHPDANTNFSDSWMSHFQPSLEHNALVYLVNTFYTILIPLVLGGFAVFIGTDVYRRGRNRSKTRGASKDE